MNPCSPMMNMILPVYFSNSSPIQRGIDPTHERLNMHIVLSSSVAVRYCPDHSHLDRLPLHCHWGEQAVSPAQTTAFSSNSLPQWNRVLDHLPWHTPPGCMVKGLVLREGEWHAQAGSVRKTCIQGKLGRSKGWDVYVHTQRNMRV